MQSNLARSIQTEIFQSQLIFILLLGSGFMKNWTDTSTKIMKPPAASAQYAIWWTTNRVLILLSSAFSFEALKVGCPFREDNCFIAALSDDWSKLNWGTSKKFYLFVTDHDWKDRLIVHKNSLRTTAQELLMSLCLYSMEECFTLLCLHSIKYSSQCEPRAIYSNSKR